MPRIELYGIITGLSIMRSYAPAVALDHEAVLVARVFLYRPRRVRAGPHIRHPWSERACHPPRCTAYRDFADQSLGVRHYLPPVPAVTTRSPGRRSELDSHVDRADALCESGNRKKSGEKQPRDLHIPSPGKVFYRGLPRYFSVQRPTLTLAHDRVRANGAVCSQAACWRRSCRCFRAASSFRSRSAWISCCRPASMSVGVM